MAAINLSLPPLLSPRLLQLPHHLRTASAFSLLNPFPSNTTTPRYARRDGHEQSVLEGTDSLIQRIPSLIQTIWNGILLAVPKKKTSHSKARSRRLAGKALKDLQGINTCSACGRVKRMHLLCPYCVQNIKDMWSGRLERFLAREEEEERASGARGEEERASRATTK